METFCPNFKIGLTSKYKCDICQIYTNNKKDMRKHLYTQKHKRGELETLVPQNPLICQTTNNHMCKYCNKNYTSRSGLWKHVKICLKNINSKEPEIMTTMFMEIVKQNNDFKELLVEQGKELTEQNKQIIELSSKPTTTNNNTTNNNFNLQFFLNETCKDALNITDFINQLQVGTKDLEETGRIGYAAGISRIFINGLKKLNINQRPVHCSDAKRETIYIKDGGQWEKDNDENVKLTNAIRDVAHKNIEQIQVWTELHPEYTDLKSKYNDRYMKLIGEAMSGSTNEETYRNYKKIARNIMRETIIPK